MQSPDDAIKEYEGKGFLDAYPDAQDGIIDKSGQEGTLAMNNAPPEPTKRPDTQLRQVGDMALYKYYIKSVSAVTFILWLVVLVLLTLTEKGPGI